MNACIYVPNSARIAGSCIRRSLALSLENLPTDEFVCAWSSVAYLFPGLHPDGFEDLDSGWPRVLRRFAAEAWRRSDAGELADDQLYASEAQWAGLCDRLYIPDSESIKRRAAMASQWGERPDE